ncbi:MAG: hypothetical protein RL497_1155 [Pseudomonadota bacterium]|jgi:hypothetical protein
MPAACRGAIHRALVDDFPGGSLGRNKLRLCMGDGDCSGSKKVHLTRQLPVNTTTKKPPHTPLRQEFVSFNLLKFKALFYWSLKGSPLIRQACRPSQAAFLTALFLNGAKCCKAVISLAQPRLPHTLGAMSHRYQGFVRLNTPQKLNHTVFKLQR